ncbi:MAG: fuconate dehydratase [Actinomycetota bacterium]|nr:fuconate dehydratase [Actinomycetota bacterium]
MPGTITDIEALDIRFPTSRTGDGSDAMYTDPDYSAAYVIVRTDAGDGLEGHGLTFTIGRGNEVCVAAIEALKPVLLGRKADECFADMGRVWRDLVGESQLRWLGPEKGVIHLATAALVNALWDLYAKREGKPLWKLLSDMSPEDLVALVDFRYLTDALTPDDALAMLRAKEATRADREAEMRRDGLPSYITCGWMGYSDEKFAALCDDAVAAGFTHVKLTVGADLADDIRRCKIARAQIGPDRKLMVDANQRWDVGEAIEWIGQLAEYDLWFVEEPTSPDDILGHAAIARAIAPIHVATGEHVHNRTMFKQYMQAGGLSICQLDSCRLGGVNEVVAVLLLAAKFGIPVCPHSGGVGLPEYVQHLSLFDYICVSGDLTDRFVEYVDHLHEHFVDPAVTRNGRYVVPQSPGYSATMWPESLRRHEFPAGAEWAGR